MLKPAGTLSLKDILSLKDEGNLNNPFLHYMKVIKKSRGTTLCLPFLLMYHCDFTDPCGYHLWVNDTNRLPGTSNAKYKPFHNWLEENKYNVCLITADSHNAKLDPSSSS